MNADDRFEPFVGFRGGAPFRNSRHAPGVGLADGPGGRIAKPAADFGIRLRDLAGVGLRRLNWVINGPNVSVPSRLSAGRHVLGPIQSARVMPHERRRFVFSGSVQGVGFRASARQAARHFRVAGFVRNLPDGRVELVADGEPGEVAALIEEVRREFGALIREVADELVPASDEPLEGFNIRF